MALCTHSGVKGDRKIVTIYRSREKWLCRSVFSNVMHNVKLGSQRRVHHSLQIIHLYFHEVLQAILKLSPEMVVYSKPELDTKSWRTEL